LIEARPAEIVVANRTPTRPRSWSIAMPTGHGQHGVTLSARSLSEPGTAYDVFINGTAASLSGGGIPVGPEVLRPGSLALDMMYGPAAQAFLDWARAHGAIARDGLGMLVEQAAESFALWRGVRPDTAPVLAAMRALVDGAASH
jgi:shikimate dehydrogenase